MSVLGMAAKGQWRSLSPGAGHWLGRIVAAVTSEWRLRRQVAFLLEQNDYMLRDLGLCRSDVERIVRCGRQD